MLSACIVASQLIVALFYFILLPYDNYKQHFLQLAQQASAVVQSAVHLS
jgi:hypothetical protein